MDKPNFLQKAAEFFGFSSEKLEVMSEAEKTKLEGFGEQMATAESQIESLTAQVTSATEALVRVEADVAAKDATIAELENTIEARDQEIQSLANQLQAAQAEIQSLGAQLAALPGAETTAVTSVADPVISTQNDDPQVIESPITKEAKALLGI